MLPKLCIATNNEHKFVEIKKLLADLFCVINLHDVGCHEDLPEDGDTLEKNSKQKAEYVFEHYGIPCLADDTGLEVGVLGNAPGVYSARYAGDQKSDEDNIRLLLRNLQGETHRKARFRTVFTMKLASKRRVQFEGVVEGKILENKRGTNGFGYDPIFCPSGSVKSMAEMTLEEKNGISHRKKAMDKFIFFLTESPLYTVS